MPLFDLVCMGCLGWFCTGSISGASMCSKVVGLTALVVD